MTHLLRLAARLVPAVASGTHVLDHIIWVAGTHQCLQLRVFADRNHGLRGLLRWLLDGLLVGQYRGLGAVHRLSHHRRCGAGLPIYFRRFGGSLGHLLHRLHGLAATFLVGNSFGRGGCVLHADVALLLADSSIGLECAHRLNPRGNCHCLGRSEVYL